MMSRRTPETNRAANKSLVLSAGDYGRLVADISGPLERSQRGAVRSVNAILTATYWEIGRRIVEHEQGGKARAEYGEELLGQLSRDLSARHGRGFSARNLRQMRAFYLSWEIWRTPPAKFEARAKCPALADDIGKWQTPSAELVIAQAPSGLSSFMAIAGAFPLSWSHYVRLLAVDQPHARLFYESEAIRGGWSVRQLDRQIGTQFFE
jgi:hypothetical protein